MINTLEDMLVEVQKIYGNNATLHHNTIWINNKSQSVDHEIIFELNYWWFDNYKSKNPQDILDIIRTIHNCGLLEEEKMK